MNLKSTRAKVGKSTLLLVSLWPVSEKKKKNDVYIFKWLGKKYKKQYSVTHENSSPTLVSINKVLSEYSHVHSFIYCPCLLSHYNDRVT